MVYYPFKCCTYVHRHLSGLLEKYLYTAIDTHRVLNTFVLTDFPGQIRKLQDCVLNAFILSQTRLCILVVSSGVCVCVCGPRSPCISCISAAGSWALSRCRGGRGGGHHDTQQRDFWSPVWFTLTTTCENILAACSCTLSREDRSSERQLKRNPGPGALCVAILSGYKSVDGKKKRHTVGKKIKVGDHDKVVYEKCCFNSQTFIKFATQLFFSQ